MSEQNIKDKTGWAIDVTSKNSTHYYENGVSLCKKAIVKFHMTKFNKEKDYSGVLGFNCSLCYKKLINENK